VTTYFHGTAQALPVGTRLRAGVVQGNWNNASGLASQVVWLTDDPADAKKWATGDQAAQGAGSAAARTGTGVRRQHEDDLEDREATSVGASGLTWAPAGSRRTASFFMHDADEPLIDTKPMAGFEEKAAFDFFHSQIATVKGVVSGRRDFEDSLLLEGQENLGIRVLSLPVPDNGVNKPTSWFKAAIDFCLPILRSGGKVYIHCHAGMNRGPSLAYAVHRAYTGASHQESFDLIKRCRDVALIGYAADADKALVELGYAEETAEVDAGEFHTITGSKDDRFKGVSLKQDDKGKWYVTTHRARSDSYDTPEDIPQKDITFIESTGSKTAGTGTGPWWHGCSVRRAAEVAERGYFPADYTPGTQVWGPGVYLTSDPSEAQRFGATFIPVRPAATKVFTGSKKTTEMTALLEAAGIDTKAEFTPDGYFSPTHSGQVHEVLRRHGYDALLLPGVRDWLIVWNPVQAHFDPTRPVGKQQVAAGHRLSFKYLVEVEWSSRKEPGLNVGTHIEIVEVEAETDSEAIRQAASQVDSGYIHARDRRPALPDGMVTRTTILEMEL
jgi:hypothetical protein